MAQGHGSVSRPEAHRRELKLQVAQQQRGNLKAVEKTCLEEWARTPAAQEGNLSTQM